MNGQNEVALGIRLHLAIPPFDLLLFPLPPFSKKKQEQIVSKLKPYHDGTYCHLLLSTSMVYVLRNDKNNNTFLPLTSSFAFPSTENKNTDVQEPPDFYIVIFHSPLL